MKPCSSSSSQVDEYVEPDNSKPVYMIETQSDDASSSSLTKKLRKAGYQLQTFKDCCGIIEACNDTLPTAIFIDIVFSDNHAPGEDLDIVVRIKRSINDCPPVFILANEDDIKYRLAAARAGATRYFAKPLSKRKLIQALEGLTIRQSHTPYRILFVDDDELMLEFYSTVFEDTGMVVDTLSQPLATLEYLAEFRPDILVLDVQMPDCSGPELARVIRQDDTWARLPIMFVSAESEHSSQLLAMNLGGDDFLTKPVEPGHLIESIRVKVKRARQINQLNKKLENAMRENDYQLATMNQHDIVSVADVTGSILHVNDKFCEISGYSREELLGQNHRLLKSDYHPDSFYKDMWRTIARGKVWHGTIQNRKKNGDVYWVDSTIVPFLDNKGKPYKYVSARTDVTELRQSEERLHRSQTFANIGTWDWNIQTGDLYWSERIGPLFGFNDEVPETTYDNFLAAVHPDDRQMVVDAVNNCVEQGARYHIEHRVVWPDGSIHWVQENGDVIRDKAGTPLHMLGVVQDINSRKLAELSLVEREQQLLDAQSIANLGSWQADLRSGELCWSDEIYRIFGHASKSFKPSVAAFKSAIHPDDLSLVEASEKHAEQTGFHDVIHRIVRPDGAIRHVHELAEAETDAEGNLVRLFGTVQDITEQMETQQNLVKAREEAEEASRAKSQFLSSMSHELRTPMNAILGFGQLLELDTSHPLSENQHDCVNEIVTAGHHLLNLINEVLDLSRIEEGHLELVVEDVMISDVVAESFQLIMPLAQQRNIGIVMLRKGVELTFDELSQQTSEVQADRTRLKQVLLNLLSNAVKYNRDNGKITIACHPVENNSLRISISDEGAGLSEEQQEQLFQPFNRLGATRSDIEGAGIGLTITKRIVELMDGQIGVDSQPGEGSTFWFELPIATKEIDSEEIDSEETNPDSFSSDVVTSRSGQSAIISEAMEMSNETPGADKRHKAKYTVLYIEDNPANLRLVSQLMQRQFGVQLLTATEPEPGIELAIEHKPDLVLLDINLPVMDGYVVLQKLREHDSLQTTPVIAISANAMPKDVDKGLQAGFASYITKPIVVVDFIDTMDKVLTA